MALNLDDLIGSMQSVYAGDRGQGIEEIRENLRITLGQAAMGPHIRDVPSGTSGSAAIKMNGVYRHRYNSGSSAGAISSSSSSGGVNGAAAKKRRLLGHSGYPQPHYNTHHHSNSQMRQHPHCSSPSQSGLRGRSRVGTRSMHEAADARSFEAIEADDDSRGDATMIGEEGGKSDSYFGQRNPSCPPGDHGDLNLPYPSPVNGFGLVPNTPAPTQRLPTGSSTATDMALSPATSSYPKSYTSNTSSSGAGPSSFASTSASSHSAAGSSGFYRIGGGAAPPANTPQQTPSDKGDTLAAASARLARPVDSEDEPLWVGHADREDARMRSRPLGISPPSQPYLLDDGVGSEEAMMTSAPAYLTVGPSDTSLHIDRDGEEARAALLGYSRPGSSSPKKLVSGFTPTIQS